MQATDPPLRDLSAPRAKSAAPAVVTTALLLVGVSAYLLGNRGAQPEAVRIVNPCPVTWSAALYDSTPQQGVEPRLLIVLEPGVTRVPQLDASDVTSDWVLALGEEDSDVRSLRYPLGNWYAVGVAVIPALTCP